MPVNIRTLNLGREVFMRTDDGSELMNIDGRAAGSPVVLWNGSGAGDTGADWAVSGKGSETAESKHSGTYGWDTSVAVEGDTTVWNNGSPVDIAGTYSELNLWLQPKAFPVGSRLQVRWLDGSDVSVSDQLRIDQYAVNMDIGVWQKVSIPISDFNLTGNAQKLRFRYGNVAGQRYWFDDIELITIAGGGPYRFRVKAPDASTIYHLSVAKLLITATASGWNQNAFANIAGGLNLGLICRHRRLSVGEVLWNFTVKNNLQLFGQYHAQEPFVFADGNMLVSFVVDPGKGGVLITDDDVLEFVVRDNLSSIGEMRAYCHYGVEVL